jgi:exonuclease III
MGSDGTLRKKAQPFASVPKLTLAQAVWYAYKVQFMRNLRALDQLAKPHTLFLCGGCEIEHQEISFEKGRKCEA